MAANNATNNTMTELEAYELVIERVFEAPRALVWNAWTEPERLIQWWGPKGFTIDIASFDFRPGGAFLYSQRSPDGKEMWGKFVYREIAAPERMVFISSLTDPLGNPIRNPMIRDWPLEILNTLTLTESGGKTRLVLRGVPFAAAEIERKTFADARAGVQQAFKDTFDQLAVYLTNI